ncbi:NAD(P)-dependent oxidoreductase [Tepidibacter formicigenes]|uniref:Glutamate synthase (NADPH/NADH) small chain n=1 Tax=Tepidibacter formicigenes DSM 15518 TaxID=1123349 RepID=A0A1M6KSL0_9FIRM|nr:NAD(P)-dependent oxidoreductase [Tepidibacter formicigenes]SHJ61872.1 glutamate synthase (NADPH/NADH) small chain [Tepidibacter formicigenes DSM 15518]
MGRHIIEEARRCLQCKKPRCKQGCPVNTSIPEVINLLLNNDIKEAGKILFNNNPLSVICSLVCPHENQCEGHCILGVKGNPVQISSIENYISDYYLNSSTLKKEKNLNRKVAIVGSGPAGIVVAFMLSLKGYDITIFEAHDKIGGVLRYGIPEFRLPKDILERLKNKLIELGVKIRPNTLIGPVITIDNLFRDGYDAIFIGTGVWKPNTLNIKGESLGHVHFAIDYLKNPNVYDLGEKVCVIGAGNVAMDVARTAIRKGAKDVYIMYRKDIEDMSATKYEIEYAKIDGVKFELFKTPIEIVDEGVKYLKTKKITDDSGYTKVVPIKDSEGIFTCNSVIIAVSQGPRANIVSNTNGINTGTTGLVMTDDYGRTSREGVFASGDVVTGAKTVVEAVNLSKKVAMAIDEYITKKYEK